MKHIPSKYQSSQIANHLPQIYADDRDYINS